MMKPSNRSQRARGVLPSLFRAVGTNSKALVVTVGLACVVMGSMSHAAEVGSWLDAEGESLSAQSAVKQIGKADVVLLGEVHDSADIHNRQVALLKALASQPIVLALEQLDLEYWDALVSKRESNEGVGARALADAGGFDEEGWGWNHYGPLFELGVANGWPVLPLNLSRRKAMAIAMAKEDPLESLSNQQQQVLISQSSDLALPSSLQGNLLDTLVGAHCGEMDRDVARRIARAHIARDVLMADAIERMRAMFPESRIVAIMGNQHARLDRGVGYWLEQMSANSDQVVVSVGMVPINLSSSGKKSDAHHLRLLAQRIDRPSPCVEKTAAELK